MFDQQKQRVIKHVLSNGNTYIRQYIQPKIEY